MKKNKTNIKMMGVIIAMLCAVGIVFAITLVNEQPISESTISGNVSAVTFSIDDTDDEATGGTLYIDTINNWPLVCSGSGPIICEVDIDLSATAEGNYSYYFFATNGSNPAYYPSDAMSGGRLNFTLDKIPQPPSFLTVTGIDETSLKVSWTASTSGDIIYYKVYTNDSAGYWNNTANVTGVEYNDAGLITGNYYYYNITAIDGLNQESTATGSAGSVVADSTPPVEPIIDPISGSTINIANPTININYTDSSENVTLDIITAGEVIKTFTGSNNYTWSPSLADNTTYSFQFNASDQFNNVRQTNYTLTVREGALFNISILDTEHLTTTFFPEKVSVLPGDFLILGVDISMYPDAFVRLKLSDWVSASDTILIDDMNATFFCEGDYDPIAQNIIAVPVNNVYNVSGSYDITQAALNCTDTNPSDLVEYTTYIKATIPMGTDSGAYSFDYGINNYPIVI